MNNKIKRKLSRCMSVLLAIMMIVTMIPTTAFAAGLDNSNLSFDVTDPAGYVTISFEDNGIRPQGASIANTELYGEPLGTIIEPTQVPFVEGENMAQVTVRLLDAMGIDYGCTGSPENGFYLSAIKGFEMNEKYYSQLGEFDAGAESGWCVRLNNWHINRGTADFQVEDGDTITWLYTCQYGSDIGADFSSTSAEITNIKLADPSLQLEDLGTGSYYFCSVPFSLTEIAFEVELENYASVVSVAVNGIETNYRPNKPISAVAGDVIEIRSNLEYMDANNNNQISYYSDSVTIELVGVVETPAPSVKEDAPGSLDVTLGKTACLDFTTIFDNIGNSTLTYGISCEALNLDEQWTGQTSYNLTGETAGEYTLLLTVDDGENVIEHSITLDVVERDNRAPSIKTEYAATKENTYVFTGVMYTYVFFENIFEDKDGDPLEYKILIDGEEYNPDKYEKIIVNESQIVFFESNSVRKIEITATDGIAESEVFTAYCAGTTATMKLPEDAPLIETDHPWYRYVNGMGKDDSFQLDYDLTIDKNVLDVEWRSENPSVLSVDENGKCTFVGEVTEVTSVKVGITCGTDMWGSPNWLGWIWVDIYPSAPSVEDVEAAVAENEDLTVLTEITDAFTNWRAEEFDYTVEDPSVCSVTSCEHWYEYGIDVMPKKVGQTKVTATFKKDSSIKCEFMVTVTGRSLQVKGQDNNNVFFEANKSIQLEVLGAQEGETFTWMSWDENIAFADDGWVTLFKPGTVYIEAVSSLSTDDVPIKVGMYLQIQESGKAYLDELEIPDYMYFKNMIGAKSAFNSAQLEYMWDIGENNYYYSTLAFTPYFDGENLNAVLKYSDQYKQAQSLELTDGEAVTIYDGISPGYNLVKIEVSPKDDSNNVTTYTFAINRPYNPANDIYDIMVYPNGGDALDYPMYKDYREGTVFQYDVENDTVTDCCWWDSGVYTYKTYVFGTRTNTVSFLPYFAYSGQRVMIYVNGEPLEEAVHDWKCQPIPVTEEEMKIEFYVNSEKYHEEQLATGVTNPFENPEKIYTIYVENVKPLGIDAIITSAEIENGEFYAPGFKSNVYSTKALILADTNEAELTFTVASEYNVYRDYISEETKLEAASGETDGLLTYKVKTEIPEYDNSTAINIFLEDVDQSTNESGMAQYQFIVRQRGEKDIYPDEIVEYLCLGSQYTNRSTFGLEPERTLVDNGTVLSLGNFGGYITYKYDTPIENSPNNPYGVDFVIYGNPFGEGAHEPGNVEVSEDGKTWYLLAGSDHYEDHCDWNYSMTYTNDKGESSWVNSDGESGKIYNYPTASLYPYFDWTDSKEQAMTVSGARLNSAAKDAYGSAAAVLTEFGYVDVNTNGTINGKAKNPYNHPNALETGGDQFDISWAVDEKGMPVELDSISYIRVSTASSIYAGAIGEKSTEVTTVNRITNPAEEAVGVTDAPISIMINGEEVSASSAGNVIPANTVEGEVKIDVEVPEGTHVYINNRYGASRTYEELPEKGIVRIIVQEAEKEAYILYISFNSDSDSEHEHVYGSEWKFDGNQHWNECACGGKENAANHSFEWVVDKAATEIETGAKHEECTVCHAVRSENTEIPATGENIPDDIDKIYKTTGDYLAGLGTPNVGSIGGEWMVLGLARSGRDVSEAYYDNVVAYVKENINENGQLHWYKSTDNSRLIVALTAVGYDVTNVGGYNLLKGLTNMDYVTQQGNNGAIWALIAFDSHDYEIPEAPAGTKQVTREKLVEEILSTQLENGGWNTSRTSTAADVDMTAMAIQALAPYYKNNENVKTAIDKALTLLSSLQNNDGGFYSTSSINSEACAQVIVALTALGINPDTDARFVKNGNSVVKALCMFYVEGGGFKHVLNGSLDGMATEQGYYALVSYVRMLNGQTSLYDMSDVKLGDGESSGSGTGTGTEDGNGTGDGSETGKDSEKNDQTAAEKVEDLIDTIGKVTVNSGLKITTARNAYNNLTAAQKRLVDNYAELIAAETAFDDAKANYVESLIDAIGTVTVNSASRIAKARVAYYNLTDAQKKLVDNYEYLLYAESALEEARVEYVEDLIDSIGTVTKNSKTKINRARTAYNNLSDSNKALVSNLNVLLEAEAAYTKLAAASTTTKPTTKPSAKPATKDEDTEEVTEDLTKFAEKVNEQIESINDNSLAGEMLDAILAYEELTEEEKAAIDKEWIIENLKERVAEELQTDRKTGVGVSGAEWNIQIVVEDVLDVTEIQYMQEKLGGNTMLGLWDIYLKDVLTGKEVQPEGSVLIKIPLSLLGDYTSYDGLAVVQYAEDGTVEYLNSTLIGDCIAFNATEFSYYAVAGYMGASPLDNLTDDVVSDNVNASGTPALPWLIGGGCGLALLAVILLMLLKNRKAQAGE